MSVLKVNYDDGDSYDGEWSEDGKRHGIGVLMLKNGVKYSGQFEKGFFHGSGVLNFSDGNTYEGNFVLGKFHGYGVYKGHDGMKFEGQFHEGTAHGLGIITFPNGGHGRPTFEGRFQGNECIQRVHSGEAPKKARQAAALARTIL